MLYHPTMTATRVNMGRSLLFGACLALAWPALLTCSGCNDRDQHGDGDSDAPDVAGDDGAEDGPDIACPTCDDGNPCTVDTCITSSNTCYNEQYDADGDGYPGFLGPDGVTACPGNDCDDGDPLAHPGAAEICMDWIDEDCDAIADSPRAMLGTVHLETLDSGGLNPSVAWTGSEFLAAWDDFEPVDFRTEIFMARVDPAGEMAGGAAFQVTNHSATGTHGMFPRLQWTGSEIGLLYTSGDPSAMLEVVLLRLDPEGSALATETRLNDVDTFSSTGGLYWTGSGYGVLWQDGRDGPCSDMATCESEVFFTLADGDGVEAGPDERISSAPTGTASTAGAESPLWTGSEFLVFWGVWHGTGDVESYLTRLDADGARVGSDVVVAHVPTSTAWTGSEVALAWESDLSGNTEVFLSRLDPEGAEIGSAVQVTDAPHFSGRGALAWTGSQLGVAWIDGRNTSCDDGPDTPFTCDYDIYFDVLDPGGAALWDEIVVDVRAGWRPFVRLVWTGSEFGLVWMEEAEEGVTEVAVAFDRVSFCE